MVMNLWIFNSGTNTPCTLEDALVWICVQCAEDMERSLVFHVNVMTGPRHPRAHQSLPSVIQI